jgi:hypothetical protein
VLEAAHFLFPKFFHKAFDLASGCGEVNVDRDDGRRKGEVDSTGSEHASTVIASVESADLQQLALWREGTPSETEKPSDSVELNP